MYYCCPRLLELRQYLRAGIPVPGKRIDSPELIVSLSKEQVQHIATLARLSVDEKEIDDVVAKLSSIVDFVDQLQAAPTDDVVPMAHPMDMSQRLRADVVTEGNERDRIQQNAPSVQDGLYLVPRVLD